MDRTDLQDISKIIHSIGKHPFVPTIKQYIELDSGTLDGNKARKTVMALQHDIQKHATSLMSLTAISISRIFHLEFPDGAAAKDAKSRHLFRNLKKQQLDLLSFISDEVEMITSIIQQSGKFQGILQCHTEQIQNVEYLIRIMRDRLSNRPTTLQRIESGDMAPQIEFQHDIPSTPAPDPETNIMENLLKTVSQETPGKIGSAPCPDVFESEKSDIHNRLTVLVKACEELIQGWKLLERMSLRGSAGWKRWAIQRVIDKAARRRHEFDRYIMQCRLSQIHPENTMVI